VPDHPEGRVSDYAHALTPTDLRQLNEQLQSYASGTRQIAVAIFPSLDGESIEDFSIRLAEKWKIGGKKNDDGVLVTVFLADHKLRIEVGYGLEDKLTDALSSRIIREIIAPRFQKGDVAGGLRAGLAEINAVISGGQPSLPPETRSHQSIAPFIAFLALFIFILVIGIIRRGGGGGGFTGGAAGWIIGSLLSGGGGGGGWSSGGGGGFSGGGGSFGGGGASGSW
jgi:uncharacterized protein